MDKSLNSKLKIKSTNVNLLKFVAALLVILCHAYPITDNGVDILSRYTNGACNFGGFAVGIFFFFSGLYVAKSFSRVDTIWNYFKKRIERIFPQLIIVVLLSAFVLGPIITSLSVGEYFSNKSTYLYLLNAVLIPVHDLPGVFQGGSFQTVNGPLWTMPVEFACYIMLAVIVFLAYLASKKTRSSTKGESINSKPAKVLLWLAVFVFVVAFFYVNFILKNDFLVSAVRPIILFTLGCLYYEYRESIKLNLGVGLIALLGLAVSGFAGFFSIGMILFLPYCIVEFTLGIPQIRADWKIFKLSYEMYLFGWPIQQVVLGFFDHKMPALMNMIITVPFDIILAYILFSIIEKWEESKKKRKKDKESLNKDIVNDEKLSGADDEGNDKKLSMKKSVMWNTFGSFFYYFCQWLMTVLVVRLSGLEDAGTLTLCISISNIWISLSSFGMHNYQASDTRDKYSFKTYLNSRYFTGGAAFFACLIYLVAMGYSLHTNICVVFYFLYRFSESLEDVYYAAFQKSWRIDIPGKSMVIRGVISIVLFSVILVGTKNLAWTIGLIFAACMLTVYLYDAKKGRIFKIHETDPKMVKLLIIECLPLAIYTLLNTFVPMAPRLILEHLLGNVKLGIYGSIATPTVVVQMIATYVFNPFITLFAEELEKGDIKAFSKTLKKCILWLGGISIASVIGGLLLGKIGLFILYGAKVAKYTELLTPLIVCSALIAFMWLLGGVLVAARSFKWLLFSNILSSVTIIPLSYILEDEFDMQGASYATIISITLAIIILCIGLTIEVAKRKRLQADIQE